MILAILNRIVLAKVAHSLADEAWVFSVEFNGLKAEFNDIQEARFVFDLIFAFTVANRLN
jgi:hypothetical protein